MLRLHRNLRARPISTIRAGRIAAGTLTVGTVVLARVGKLLGHISSVTTERYAHLDDTPADDVLRALSPRSAPEPDGPPAAGGLRLVK